MFGNMYGLLTKRDGWILALFCLCVSRSIYTQKRTRPISSHLDRASLVIKGFIIWDKTPKHDLYTCGTKPVSRAGKKLHLTRSGSGQSQREIRFILPAHGARHKIISFILMISLTENAFILQREV